MDFYLEKQNDVDASFSLNETKAIYPALYIPVTKASEIEAHRIGYSLTQR